MILFKKSKNDIVKIKESFFKLEKEIQLLFEVNLEEITGLQFVKSEFIIKNNRIDTLAFNKESNSFVIIEYKNSKNYSIIDQGFSYLNLMLENKTEFIVEYNEALNKNLKRSNIDWSQSKIIFVSSEFTNFQKQASNFKDLPIELLEIKKYDNDLIVMDIIEKTSSSNMNQIKSNKDTLNISKVVKEIKIYTEEDHLNNKSDNIKELYENFKDAIFQLSSDLKIRAQKQYIAFKKDRNIVDVNIQSKGLKLFINMKKGELDDPKNITIDVSKLGHWGNGDYQIIVEDTKNIEYIMSLIKQAILKQ